MASVCAAIVPGLPIRVRHIGAALDPTLGEAARELARGEPRYRYSGPLPHGLARAALRSAHLLVHPSIVEGGANVIVEAVTAGTPVVASRISGNVGMLGADYAGYFEPGDAAALAERLVQALEDPRALARLREAVRPGGVAALNVLIEGTTYMGMFDPDAYCLFGRDELGFAIVCAGAVAERLERAAVGLAPPHPPPRRAPAAAAATTTVCRRIARSLRPRLEPGRQSGGTRYARRGTAPGRGTQPRQRWRRSRHP